MMRSRSQVAWLAAVFIGVLPLGVYSKDQESTGPGSSPPRKTSQASELLLAREMFVSQAVVNQFFPEMTRFNLDATVAAFDKSVAARIASYSNSDGSKRVTLRVAQFENVSKAAVAYKEASQRAQLAESEAIAIANVGQQVFAGTITKGAHSDIEITTLNDTLVLGATLTGYEVTTENIAKLAELVRKELSQAQTRMIARPKR